MPINLHDKTRAFVYSNKWRIKEKTWTIFCTKQTDQTGNTGGADNILCGSFLRLYSAGEMPITLAKRREK